MSDPDRLYDLLPAALRARDAGVGEPLRALLGVLSAELGAIETDIETTWDNWFVETCEEWLVPYLGDALGVPGLRDVDATGFSLRAYVANTLERRRRKGTIAATEQLARDVTGYPARAVEMFAVTATTAAVDHARLRDADGVVLGTVDVRDPAVVSRVGGAFDPFVHTPDVRSLANGDVRHGLVNVEIFLWRLEAQELSGVTARVDPADDRWFRFDALGADRPVFTLPVGETDGATRAGAQHVPRPLTRQELKRLGTAADWPVRVWVERDDPDDPDELIPIVCHLGGVGGALPSRLPPDADHVLVDPELGRLVVHPDVVDGDPVEVLVDLVHGFPGSVGAGPADRTDRQVRRADDVDVRFQCGVVRNPSPVGTETLVATLEEAVLAWNAFIGAVPSDQRARTAGAVVIMDSRTHAAPTTAIDLPDGCHLTVVAGSWPRTEVDGVVDRHRGVVDPHRLRPHVVGDVRAAGQASAGVAAGSLVLDGLLLEGAVVVGPGELAGLRISGSTVAGVDEGVVVETGVEGGNSQLDLEVAWSILPAVVSQGPVARISVEASFVGTGAVAVGAPGAELTATGSTLHGSLACQVLEASDCLLDEGSTDPVAGYRVTQTQQGCVRFSHVPRGASMPRRYRCQPDLALDGVTDLEEQRRISRAVHPVLATDLADPGFALLPPDSHPALLTAASDGSEPGTWHHRQHARRMANLRLALDQDLRFGLDAGVVLDR